jgi:hypothetical protein
MIQVQDTSITGKYQDPGYSCWKVRKQVGLGADPKAGQRSSGQSGEQSHGKK